MTIKELLEMELHEEYDFNHGIVIRVPGGWIYEIEAYKNGVYTGRTTSCFVPEPSLQTITPADGCVNPNIEPNSMAYWNGLPVIHDKFAKRYLIIMSEGQFESLIKAQGEE